MQQFFRLLTFLIQPYTFRVTNSPIIRSTFWLYTRIQLLVQCTDTAADRCHVALVGSSVSALYQKLYIVKKCSWGWVNLSSETCIAELKRWINEKVVASCWLFTSLGFWYELPRGWGGDAFLRHYNQIPVAPCCLLYNRYRTYVHRIKLIGECNWAFACM